MPNNNSEQKSGRYPNLICPGAQKSGTTTLFRALNQHPEISNAAGKELKYFNKYFHRGSDWYKNLATDGEETKYLMDFTPGYMAEEIYVQRIKDLLGDSARFIFILRNPVDRMYSTYHMYTQIGLENQSDHRKALYRDYDGFLNGKRKTNYFRHSLYADQVEYFYKRFSADKIKVVIFEEFVKDQKAVVKDILNFLGLEETENMAHDVWANESAGTKTPRLARVIRLIIDNIPNFIKKKVSLKKEKKIRQLLRKKVFANSGKVKYQKNEELCCEFMEKFVPDIIKLEKLIGKDLGLWMSKYKR